MLPPLYYKTAPVAVTKIATTTGFSDAPVTWGLREHDYHLDAPENDYTVVLFPSQPDAAHPVSAHVSETNACSSSHVLYYAINRREELGLLY